MKKLLSLLFLLSFSLNNSYLFSCEYKVERTPKESDVENLFKGYLEKCYQNHQPLSCEIKNPGSRVVRGGYLVPKHSCSYPRPGFKGYINVCILSKNENEYSQNFSFYEEDGFEYENSDYPNKRYNIINFEEFMKMQNDMKQLKAVIYANIKELNADEIIQNYPYLEIIKEIIEFHSKEQGLSEQDIKIGFAPFQRQI